ncbi:hypothetical protein HDF26_001660 [Pedobacter cryoconitis]|uniref:DUF4236 domain-containing protein n=1 Tax=Pedobacter cryoconitis TaxID=188932 RepID=UPI0017B77BED|nr:DUF4236 domain-containing protein [Pedobacter cryoconitis]MBB6271233.1 hypothetical protein [Pedobacter cryoconitis]
MLVNQQNQHPQKMAWSFHKQIKLIPGVHMNLSKSGLSIIIGAEAINNLYEPSGTINPVFSTDVHPIKTPGIPGVKEAVILSRQQRKELRNDLLSTQTSLRISQFKLIISHLLLYGFIIRTIPEHLKTDIKTQRETIKQISEEIENCYVSLDINFEPEIRIKYDQLVNAFKKLMSSHQIWHITNTHFQDRVAARSSASTTVDKKNVKFFFRSLPDIRSDFQALYFQTTNGADLYFYPGFIVIQSSGLDFEIISIEEINLQQSSIRFTEAGAVPPDSKIIGTTWFKVNKNGTPDRRFNDNYQIPIVQYGELRLLTNNRFNAEFELSNYESTEQFSSIFKEYQMIIIRSKM